MLPPTSNSRRQQCRQNLAFVNNNNNNNNNSSSRHLFRTCNLSIVVVMAAWFRLYICFFVVVTITTTTTTTATRVHPQQKQQQQQCNGLLPYYYWLVVRGGGREGRGGDLDLDSNDEEEKRSMARAKYVQEILLHRLNYVCSGQRLQDLRKWIRQNGGEAKIFPLHGVKSTTNVVDLEHLTSPSTTTTTEPPPGQQQQQQQHDPFPLDRLNLDIVPTHINNNNTPPNMFPDEPQHLIELRPPNLVQLFFRAANLGIRFAPAWSTVGLAYINPHFRKNYWYKWLAQCIGSAGAAWIKWGQWSSTRNDMFPDAFCQHLAMLHNSAPAHNWEFSQLQMESSLGLAPGSLLRVFHFFDQKPLASGSIAQVHRAILGDHLVAVKIRHPRVAQLIDLDFRIMSLAARCLDLFPGFSWLRLRESVDQFSHTMAAQAHLQVEAHHLEVLNHNFGNWPHVSFPKPIFASSSVIIESFESGEIVTEFLDRYDRLAAVLNNNKVDDAMNDKEVSKKMTELIEQQLARSKNASDVRYSFAGEEIKGFELVPISVCKFLVTTGLEVYLKMLLVDNLMHADLHPGNIMLDLRPSKILQQSPNGNYNSSVASMGDIILSPSHRMAIKLVDAGMVAQLTDHEGSIFIGLLASLGSGNGREAANFALQFSEENHHQIDDTTRLLFTRDMEMLFVDCCRGYGTGVDVGEVLRKVLGLIRKYRIRIDANYATLVVNALCVEGLALRMFPDYNLLDAARPLLESYRNICYMNDGAPKPQARRSKFVKLWLSLMYLKKKFKDHQFFNQYSTPKQKKTSFGTTKKNFFGLGEKKKVDRQTTIVNTIL